jgi:DNA-binding LacI/PurR family transcriptional regulator
MKDVARLAGVSIQTVSVVVNEKADVSAETRGRILAAIDELGYRPQTVGRSLRTGATRTIGLLVADITNPFFARMADAVEDHAHRAGYNLILYNTHSDVERERTYLHIAAERWVDGMLFVTTRDTLHGLGALRAAGIPSVAIDRVPRDYEGAWVVLDNRRTGALVAEHLLDLGHRDLAHICGPLDLRLSVERLESFEAAVRERGCQVVGHAVGDANWSCQSGYEAMRTLLAAERRPTAVFASNDRLAIGAMRAAVEAGLRVPEDLSIVGVDDIELAGYLTPPLTTVRQSLADVATLATQILLDLVHGREPAQTQVVFHPELVVRQSTASPPNQSSQRTEGGVAGTQLTQRSTHEETVQASR